MKTKPQTECFCLPGGPFGYNEVAMIPAGATHIRVTDNSRNYLGKIQPVTHTQDTWPAEYTSFSFLQKTHFASLVPCLQCKSELIPRLAITSSPQRQEGLSSPIWSLFSMQHNNQGHLFSSLFMRLKLNRPKMGHTVVLKGTLIKALSDHRGKAGKGTCFCFMSWKISLPALRRDRCHIMPAVIFLFLTACLYLNMTHLSYMES